MSSIKWHELKMTSNTSPTPYIASASTEFSSSYQAWRAFDGDFNTAWVTSDNKGSGAWIEVDFGEEVEVDAVYIRARNDSFYTQAPHIFYIEYSSDKLNYTKTQNINMPSIFSTAGQELEVNIDKIKARYFKLYGVTNGFPTSLGFSELRYGIRAKKMLVLKNPITNQHYSLADKTLFILPNLSDEIMINYGIKTDQDIKLDELFDKIITVNSDGTFTENEVDPFSVYDYISETPEFITYNESEDDLVVSTTTDPFSVYDYISDTPKVIAYSESTEDIKITISTAPYSVYDYISNNPTALIYTESTDDIIISTTTEPYTLYDEFGNEVEVLYYTDDEIISQADLIIDANWSPINELEGPIEIVTWTDEENATRTLTQEGIHEHTIVRQIEGIPMKDIAGIQMIDSAAPFVVQRDNEDVYYTYYKGTFFAVPELNEYWLSTYGLTPEIFNSIPMQEWEVFLNGNDGSSTDRLYFTYLFSDRSIYSNSASSTLDVEHRVGKIYTTRIMSKSSPSVDELTAEISEYSIEGRLKNIEQFNARNFADLQFKAIALMNATTLKFPNMSVIHFNQENSEAYVKNDDSISVPLTDIPKTGREIYVLLDLEKDGEKVSSTDLGMNKNNNTLGASLFTEGEWSNTLGYFFDNEIGEGEFPSLVIWLHDGVELKNLAYSWR